MSKSDSTIAENYPIRFGVKSGKITVRLRKCQCTVGGEAAIKIAHELMALAEKALRKTKRIKEP